MTLVSGTAAAGDGFTPSEGAAKWVGKGDGVFLELLLQTE